jgi:hypothetical protein
MSIFQLLAAVFAFFMIYVVRVKSKKHHLPTVEVLGWYAIWVLFVVLAIFPNLLLGVAQVLRFSRVFDLLTVAAFMVLTSVSMYLYFIVKELQQKIEQLVRLLSITEKRKRAGSTRQRNTL